MRWNNIAAAVLLSLCLTGCGTMINLGAQRCAIYEHPRIYGGVRIDVVHVLPDEFPLGLLCALMDLPFSLSFDTLTLPWSIPATIEYGDKDSWPEPNSPHAIVEGVVIEGDSSGYQVLPAKDIWRQLPIGMKPLSGARVHVYGRAKGLELSVQGTLTSSDNGHFSLFSPWDTPWKNLRIDCEGYDAVEIPVSEFHSPTDQSYWGDRRILIRLARRR